MVGTQATAAIRASVAHRVRGWLGLPVQRWRQFTQAGFFLLFVFAPIFDIFRLDLNLKHLILFGFDWTLGLDDFVAGRASTGEAALNIVLRGFLPLLAIGGTLIYVSWKWGRLYCGWLCPHFSVVETINQTLRRAIGKQSLWDKKPMPTRNPDGSETPHDAIWWFAVMPLVIAFAMLWAVVLLTYLLPPAEIYGNLWHGTLTRNQTIFLSCGQHRLLRRIHVRAPPVLPLCLRGRPVPEPGMDGQRQGHGGRLQARARPGLLKLLLGLRPCLPDAAEPAQRQAHDVRLRAVRPVRRRLRPHAGKQPERLPVELGARRARRIRSLVQRAHRPRCTSQTHR